MISKVGAKSRSKVSKLISVLDLIRINNSFFSIDNWIHSVASLRVDDLITHIQKIALRLLKLIKDMGKFSMDHVYKSWDVLNQTIWWAIQCKDVVSPE